MQELNVETQIALVFLYQRKVPPYRRYAEIVIFNQHAGIYEKRKIGFYLVCGIFVSVPIHKVFGLDAGLDTAINKADIPLVIHVFYRCIIRIKSSGAIRGNGGEQIGLLGSGGV